MDDPSDRRLASAVIDAIGDANVTVAAFRVGPDAEGGWQLVALDHATGERWSVTTERALDAACMLAEALGFDLEG